MTYNNTIFNTMKNLYLICTLLIALVAMTACDPKKPSNEELILGKWEVKTYYHMYHDFTDENCSFESSYTLPDTTYVGYDSIEFNNDGTSLWHMSDLYVSSGMFTDPYKHFNWIIRDDSLIVNYCQDKYAIKELNSENLVIEEYVNNGHEEYSHHHWEQIHRYTLKRVQ